MRLAEKKARGFTLIEMAIVLVIIGIILAGVMKGRDIVRGAQIKQFSQQFGQKWLTLASTYYDKTGQFLADGQINGGTDATDPDGMMDGTVYTADVSQTVYDRLVSVGINPCMLIKSKLTAPVDGNPTGAAYTAVCGGGGAGAGTVDRLNPFQTTVDGEYAALAVVSVDLRAFTLNIGGQDYRRNVVVLYNVPVDVAQGLDTLVDGTANGLLGSCVGLSDNYDQDDVAGYVVTPAAPGSLDVQEWGDALDGTAAQCQTVGLILDY